MAEARKAIRRGRPSVRGRPWANRLLLTGAIVAIGVLAAWAFSAARSGSSANGNQRQSPRPVVVAGVDFVPAPHSLHLRCRATARAVGYAVPCPSMIPAGLTPTPTYRGCRIEIIRALVNPGCDHRVWHRWFFGSSNTPDQHLVMNGSPRAIADPARAINGPGWYPGARERALGSITVNGARMHWFLVPPLTNDGSAFAGHLVLLWTRGGHNYIYGFHVLSSLRDVRALDLELVRHLEMVEG